MCGGKPFGDNCTRCESSWWKFYGMSIILPNSADSNPIHRRNVWIQFNIVLYLKQLKYLKTLKLLRFWFFITSFSTLLLKDSIHTFDPPLNCTNLGWQASLLLGHFLLGPWRLSGCKPPSFRPIRSIILFRPISQDVAAHSIMKKGASWNYNK